MDINIFQYQFMIRAIIAGIAVGVIAPLIGTFLVVKKFSLIGDTLSHVALSGVALGLILGINPLLATIGVTVLASVLIEELRRKKNISGDAVLAMFLPGGLALSIVLLTVAHGFNVNLFSFLFGSISTVTESDVLLIVGLGVLTVLIVLGFYKKLFFVSMDEESAKVAGIGTERINLILVILTAITVSLSMRIVGILLIGALMVIPVVTASQIAKSFKQSIFVAILIAVGVVLVGLVISYYLGLPAGGTIVLLSLFVFIITEAFFKRK